MKTTSRFRLVLASIAVSWVGSIMANAAPITWTTRSTISGDTDVSTTGNSIYAYDVGTTGVSATTVNGVIFQPFAVPSFTNTTVTVGGNASIAPGSGDTFFSNNSGAGSANAPFSGLSSSYKTLLQSVVTASSTSDTLTLTLLSLTPGASYIVQLWSNDSGGYVGSDSNSYTNYQNRDGSPINAIGIGNDVNGTNGGVGQMLIGTFTADPNGHEAITMTNGGSTGQEVLNAFQLRSTTVPEPNTAGLFGAGVLFFCGRRRRRS